jgi:hypothetical protein
MTQRDTFYKYMNAATGRIVLENRTLRWTTPGTLNDPFDIQFDLNFKINREIVKAAILQKLWETYSGNDVPVGNTLGVLMVAIRELVPGWSRERFEREFALPFDESFDKGEARLPQVSAETRELISDSKILCLTTECENTLMWAHYADGHQGLVLRFRNIPELDSPYSMARPVQYVENMPVLMDDDFLSDMMSGRVSFDVQSIMDRLMYTKSSEWAYENEWRICSGVGRDPDASHEDCPFDARELDAVVFGCRMNENNKTEIVALARDLYPHAELLQTRKRADFFKLEVVPIECI